MSEFGDYRQIVWDRLVAARRHADTLGTPGVVDALDDVQRQLRHNRFVVAVCGEFKRGKSSLINAYLDEPGLLPVAIDVATNVATSIAWGEREQAFVSSIGPDGTDTSRSIGRADIVDYVSEQGNRRNAKGVDHLYIEIPNAKLRTGLVLVDTPGVGGINPAHAAMTLSFLPRCDAVLFVADVLEPLRAEELRFVADVMRHVRHAIFVLTKVDLTNPGPIVADTRVTLARALGRPMSDVSLVAVSSQLKLDYLDSNDKADLDESNFEALDAELWRLLEIDRARLLLLRVTEILDYCLGAMCLPLQAELKAYTSQTEEALNDYAEQLEQLEGKLADLIDSSSIWRSRLAEDLQLAITSIEEKFDAEMRRIEASVRDEYLNDPRLVAQPAEVGALINRRVAILLGVTQRRLDESADEVCRRLRNRSDIEIDPPPPTRCSYPSPCLRPEPTLSRDPPVANECFGLSQSPIRSTP